MKDFLIIKLILLLAYIGSSTIHAQDVDNPDFNLGLKLGANISQVVFDPGINQVINPGFVGGFSFQHNNHKNLGIQLEINYLQSGWKEELNSLSKYSRRLHYLQVPLMTHARIGQGNTRMLLNFGPFFSILLSDQKNINLASDVPEQEYYRDETGHMMEFGLCLGTGISVKSSFGIIQLEGRINYSLSDIYKPPPESMFTSSNNLSLEVTLSYFFDLDNLKSDATNIFGR